MKIINKPFLDEPFVSLVFDVVLACLILFLIFSLYNEDVELGAGDSIIVLFCDQNVSTAALTWRFNFVSLK